MDGIVVKRFCGDQMLDPDGFSLLAGDYFDTDQQIRDTWGTYGLFHAFLVNDLVESSTRAEGYLYYGVLCIGTVIYSKTYSLHYGAYAEVVTTYLHSAYRDDKEILRKFANLRRNTVLKLGVSRYNEVKHLDDNVTLHRMRKV